ncbi:hypothetical protein [Nonomuraea diastatica]|uniref:Uncharacterized protein n=1 Tax=Nonomuraea diastatica TaxID=1848329 RepID=A0A4R4W2T7_9ACTN|nr:hypothetical protein [Nonomuraea diastatica]TDD12889.1 hypothetical protein E1294_43140 [Nonomuraea diastatica]
MMTTRERAPRRGRPLLRWLSNGQKATLARGAAGQAMESAHPITLRWLEARRLIRRRGPGPYAPWVITTAGRAAHQWGHYTPLHVRGTTRILTVAELETTYVVLTGMLHHDQARREPADRELEHYQQRVAGLLADGLGLSEAALPNRYVAHIAADTPLGGSPAAATSSQTGDGR